MYQAPINQRRIAHQYSTHLSTVLSPEKLNFYLKYPDLWKNRYPRHPHQWSDVSTGIVRGITVFTWLQTHIETQARNCSTTPAITWPKVCSIVEKSITLQLEAPTSRLTHRNLTRPRNLMKTLTATQTMKDILISNVIS